MGHCGAVQGPFAIPPVLPMESAKIFNDPVHGHIELHPLCVAIVDTPQFQRLRELLQVGPTSYVFPGASHSRFAHCIGVCHLAGKFVEVLRAAPHGRPDLITERDALCVKIAGLCHDLGHGPFSHTYDGKFVRRVRKGDPFVASWAHEHTSAELVHRIVFDPAHGLEEQFRAHGLVPEEDVPFIQELIFGGRGEAPPGWVWRGRSVVDGVDRKGCLYEIVANHRNGIDVDKFDYFERDARHLGMNVTFDANRLMRFARVHVDPKTGESQVAYHEKEAWNIYELFHTRYNLHKRAYQHRVAHAVERMLCDALVLANDHIYLPGASAEADPKAPGTAVRMSHAMHDLDAFTRLTDSIFRIIEHRAVEGNAPLAAAGALLQRIERRDLYRHVGEKLLLPGSALTDMDPATIVERVVSYAADGEAEELASLIYVDKVRINYGMGDRNPIDAVTFYLRTSSMEGRSLGRDQVSCFIPHIFQETYVRLYCTSSDPRHLRISRDAFEAWCESVDPCGGVSPATVTPAKRPRVS